MVWFDIVSCWGVGNRVKCPFFDVLVARDLVPALEFVAVDGAVVTSLRFPVALERAFVVVDRAVLRVGFEVTEDNELWIEVAVGLELFFEVFFGEGDVPEGLGDCFGVGRKHEISVVMRIEMRTMQTRMMSSSSS